jgi:hypothetical protein
VPYWSLAVAVNCSVLPETTDTEAGETVMVVSTGMYVIVRPTVVVADP